MINDREDWTEMEYEKDMERMKQYYPAETKEIMELVEQNQRQEI